MTSVAIFVHITKYDLFIESNQICMAKGRFLSPKN